MEKREAAQDEQQETTAIVTHVDQGETEDRNAEPDTQWTWTHCLSVHKTATQEHDV